MKKITDKTIRELKENNKRTLILAENRSRVWFICDLLNNARIPRKNYTITTSREFQQRLIRDYVSYKDITSDILENPERTAIELINVKPIKEVIQISYSGLLVDENNYKTKFCVALGKVLDDTKEKD